MLGNSPPDFAAIFGSVLRRLRKQLGMSQEQLGFEADLQRNYISLLELGRYQPTLATIFSLAAALKTTPSALIAEVERAFAGTAKKARKG